jgi:hypothetical protein
MSKTISLRLNSEEEGVLRRLLEMGISPSRLLRNALQHYVKFGEIDFDEKVYKDVNLVNQIYQEDEKNIDQKPYKEVNQVNQVNKDVNLLRREVNIDGKNVNLERREVNLSDENVNLLRREVNQTEDKFLSLYIDQLNSRIQQLNNEAQEWRNKDVTETQYLKDLYTSLQTEYVNQTKDSIRRLDDKFDRLMFYLEESRRPNLPSDMLPPAKKELDTNVEDILKVSKKKHPEKPKKGWVFQMYRM